MHPNQPPSGIEWVKWEPSSAAPRSRLQKTQCPFDARGSQRGQYWPSDGVFGKPSMGQGFLHSPRQAFSLILPPPGNHLPHRNLPAAPGRRTAQVCAVRCNSRSVLPACTALGSRTPSPSALCSLSALWPVRTIGRKISSPPLSDTMVQRHAQFPRPLGLEQMSTRALSVCWTNAVAGGIPFSPSSGHSSASSISLSLLLVQRLCWSGLCSDHPPLFLMTPLTWFRLTVPKEAPCLLTG